MTNECINCKHQCEDNDGYDVDFICHKGGKRKRVQPDDTCIGFEERGQTDE